LVCGGGEGGGARRVTGRARGGERVRFSAVVEVEVVTWNYGGTHAALHPSQCGITTACCAAEYTISWMRCMAMATLGG
jgi:hypothetical protein